MSEKGQVVLLPRITRLAVSKSKKSLRRVASRRQTVAKTSMMALDPNNIFKKNDSRFVVVENPDFFRDSIFGEGVEGMGNHR